MHRENQVGSIEPGKLADLVVVSEDPMAVVVDDLPDLTVDQVWVGGRLG
jgi:hypothetical protein